VYSSYENRHLMISISKSADHYVSKASICLVSTGRLYAMEMPHRRWLLL